MLRRCYSGEYQTYDDCIVRDRWLVFPNFLEDISLIPNYDQWRDNSNSRMCLDKDVNGNGDKWY